ncbi:unnamed protein product [Somion occarium]|uniref:60S ribosomal protein L36 n=1 Tax=Somion occarium TaxID=3059160 RepID=A0ABP1D1D5_9APHY
MVRSNLRHGLNKGHPTTPIPKTVRPSQRKGIQSQRTKFVRSVVREVAGFSPYERRVMELLRNSKDKKARKLTKKRVRSIVTMTQKLPVLHSFKLFSWALSCAQSVSSRSLAISSRRAEGQVTKSCLTRGEIERSTLVGSRRLFVFLRRLHAP